MARTSSGAYWLFCYRKKDMIYSFLKEIFYGILYSTTSLRRTTGAYILMYHSVGGNGPLSVDVDEFEWQMRYVKEWCDAVPLNTVLSSVRTNTSRPVVCITFDDGFADVYHNAVPVLNRLALPATFFITTGSIGGKHRVFYGLESCMSADQIRDIHTRGYDIGAHTVNHPKLAHIPLSAAREEMMRSKAALEALVGGAVRSFAYPKGSYTDAVKKVAGESGFSVAVTVREAAVFADSDPLALPRIAVDRSTGRMRFRVGLSSAIGISGYLRRII